MAPIGKKSTPSNGGKSSALLKRLTSKKIPVTGLLEVTSRKDLAVADLLEVASRKDLAVAGLLEVASKKDLSVGGLMEVASRKDLAVAASMGRTAVPATTLVGVSSIRSNATKHSMCRVVLQGTLVQSVFTPKRMDRIEGT
jgi:hypothetical protein